MQILLKAQNPAIEISEQSEQVVAFTRFQYQFYTRVFRTARVKADHQRQRSSSQMSFRANQGLRVLFQYSILISCLKLDFILYWDLLFLNISLFFKLFLYYLFNILFYFLVKFLLFFIFYHFFFLAFLNILFIYFLVCKS